MKHLRRILTTVAVAAAFAPAPTLQAQERPGRVVGRVVDHESGKPLSGANVGIRDTDIVTITDNAGRFVLSNVPAGLQAIEAELIGYEARVAQIRVVSRETVETEVVMATEPIALPPLEVTVRSARLESVGFFTRRDDFGVQGRFITVNDIERRRPQVLTDMFYNQPGLKVEYVSAGRRRVFVSRGNTCTPMFWVDGVLNDNTDFDVVRPEVIEGVEIYIGANVPLQFHRAVGDCGVIAVWTKRGRR